MESTPKNSGQDQPTTPPPKRIWTQIHRRKKAPAVSPLTDEWEDNAPSPPPNLRMPSEKMKKS